MYNFTIIFGGFTMNWSVFILLMALAVLMPVFSYFRGDLTERQIRRKGLAGYSCLSHTGTWGDLLIIPPISALMSSYSSSWDTGQTITAVIISLAATWILHAFWAKYCPPDHNISQSKKLTPAGWLHFIFMTIVMTIAIMFYFGTDGVTRSHEIMVVVGLAIHVTLSTAVLDKIRQGRIELIAMILSAAMWGLVLRTIFHISP